MEDNKTKIAIKEGYNKILNFSVCGLSETVKIYDLKK